LDLPKASLTVPALEAKLYRELVAAIQSRSSAESYIFATSDCPEIYFLADRKNPTRTFFEMFDNDFQADPSVKLDRISRLIERHDIKVLVIQWKRYFSGGPTLQLLQYLISTKFRGTESFWFFPEANSQTTPNFTVFWRE